MEFKCIYNFSSAFAQTTDGVFTTTIVPNSELTDSSWNRYVYRVYSGSNVDFDRCTTMCAFDYPNVDGSNCHFISFESNICYLGSLAGENNLLANTMPTTLHLKTGKQTSFHIVSRSQFCAFQMCWVQAQLVSYSANFQPQPLLREEQRKPWCSALSKTLPTLKTCVHLYATHTLRPHQHVTSSLSQIKNAVWETSITLGTKTCLTKPLLHTTMRVCMIIPFPNKYFKLEYYLGFIHNSSLVTQYNLTKAPPIKWDTHIYHTAASTSLEQCAALCQLTVVSDYSCNIFSLDTTAGTCYLANHNKATSSNIPGPPGVQEIYITPCIKHIKISHMFTVFILLQPSYNPRSHPS